MGQLAIDMFRSPDGVVQAPREADAHASRAGTPTDAGMRACALKTMDPAGLPSWCDA
jgi:hypothetical protein